MSNRKDKPKEICEDSECQRPLGHRGKHRRVTVRLTVDQNEVAKAIGMVDEWVTGSGKNNVEVQNMSFYLGDDTVVS